MAQHLPLPYVPIDPLIMDSTRFGDFMDALGTDNEDTAWICLSRLLLFAGRKHIDGYLDVSPKQLARHCHWDGDPEILLAALTQSGWLIASDRGHHIEGWERHAGRVLRERERKRADYERKTERKAAKSAKAKMARIAKRSKNTAVPGILQEVSGESAATLRQSGGVSLIEHELEHEPELLNTGDKYETRGPTEQNPTRARACETQPPPAATQALAAMPQPEPEPEGGGELLGSGSVMAAPAMLCDLDAVIGFVESAFSLPKTQGWYRDNQAKAAALLPISEQELRDAWAEIRLQKRPNPGFLIAVLQRHRRQGATSIPIAGIPLGDPDNRRARDIQCSVAGAHADRAFREAHGMMGDWWATTP